jgi:hypothetical protein
MYIQGGAAGTENRYATQCARMRLGGLLPLWIDDAGRCRTRMRT